MERKNKLLWIYAQRLSGQWLAKIASHQPQLKLLSLVVCSYQKHLGVFLDKKLNFQDHIIEKNAKANTGTGVI